jgi:hypothetical protein
MPEALRALGVVTIYSADGRRAGSYERLPDDAVQDYLEPGIYLLRFERGGVYVVERSSL